MTKKKDKWIYGSNKRRESLVKCLTKTAAVSIKQAVKTEYDSYLKSNVETRVFMVSPQKLLKC